MKGCGGWFFGDDRLEYRCGERLFKDENIRLCKTCFLKSGCGKQLWVADVKGYIPICGKDGHLCKNCKQEDVPKSI